MLHQSWKLSQRKFEIEVYSVKQIPKLIFIRPTAKETLSNLITICFYHHHLPTTYQLVYTSFYVLASAAIPKRIVGYFYRNS